MFKVSFLHEDILESMHSNMCPPNKTRKQTKIHNTNKTNNNKTTTTQSNHNNDNDKTTTP